MTTRASAGGGSDRMIGTTLGGKFRVDALIATGAMGRVYRAQHLDLDVPVAIKLLHPERAHQADTAARFRQEARATSRLRHPNVITILDFGQTEAGQLYLVTELLEGRTLADILRAEWPLTPRRIADLLGQALSALDAAHALGIVHRDFKPENVYVLPGRGGEQVKVLDFGLADVAGQAAGSLAAGIDNEICGTPDYMAPEQIRGEPLDARCDLYAVGVSLYELLTATRPYAGSLVEVLSGHLHQPPEPPQLRRIDRRIRPALEAVCLKAMAKRREERFASASEMRLALESAVDDARVPCSGCGTAVPAGAAGCPGCGAAMAERRGGAGLELPPPFVGREEELARLLSVGSGVTRVVGRGGSGRTRLVEVWRRRIEAEGGSVLAVGADPSGASRAWWPIRQAVALALGIALKPGHPPDEAELRRVSAFRPRDLGGLLELFGLQSPIPVAEEEVRRAEATAAATAVLRMTSSALVFEDVDRYDPLSLEVIARLVARPDRRRIVTTSTDAAALEGGEEVRLVPLGAGAQAALGVPPEERSQLAWPLDVEQQLRARSEGMSPGAVSVGGGAEAAAVARFLALPTAARQALSVALVAGTEAPVPLVELLAGTEAVASLGLLAARGLVRVLAGRVLLPSHTLRDILYGALDAGERRHLHAALAEAHAHRGGERPGDAELVAHHAWLAAPATCDLDLLERAARAAERACDAEGASRWYHRARGRSARGDVATAARLSLSLGEVRRRAGDLLGADGAFREAMTLRRGDVQLECAARRGLARVAAASGQRERALAELEQARAAADPRTAALIALDQAEILAAAGRHEEAARAVRRSLPILGAPELAARLVLALADSLAGAGRSDEALRLATESLAHPHLPLRGRARAHALLAALQRPRDPARAATHRRTAIEELRKLGDRRALADLLLGAAADEGEGDTPLRWLAEALDLARETDWLDGLLTAEEAIARRSPRS